MAKEKTAAQLEKELAEANALNIELNTKLTSTEKQVKSGKKMVVINKVAHEVITPSFIHEGVTYKAEEMETNKALAEAILQTEGQNIVKPVEK